LKYRDEEEMLAQQVAPQRYNDEVIFPDKVRINRYYLHHYSFLKDIQMIVCTVLGWRMFMAASEFNHEPIHTVG
jgi:lipopolysaccharide/colanic/teichoic acid biosynthesis glycosyltransferase